LATIAGSIFVAAGESYLSRFFVKFIEISAAGVATAVSGYVVAHFTGYLNGPQTASLQSPPALQTPLQAPAIPASVPAAAVTPPATAVAVPAAAVATPAPASVASAPAAAAPARTTATPAPQQDAKTAPLRKSLPADKPADTVNAVAPADKARSADAIAAEVRAALAKADAGHPAKTDNKPEARAEAKADVKADAKAETKAETKPEVAPRHADTAPEIAARTPAADTKPRPLEPPTGAIAAVPPAAPPQPQLSPQPVSQPGPQAPMQIAPPTSTVEIKSMPIAGVDSATPPAPETDAQAQPTDGGLFAVFKRWPEKLRDDKPLPADQAPRPPADVGQ
jgi:hypothetical protein